MSSASLHRLKESWDWVQSMLQITRRKTMEWPITMADPLKIWTWEPNKVSFHPAFGKPCFLEQNKFFSLLTCVAKERLGACSMSKALTHIKSVKMMALLNLVSDWASCGFKSEGWKQDCITCACVRGKWPIAKPLGVLKQHMCVYSKCDHLYWQNFNEGNARAKVGVYSTVYLSDLM